MGHPIIFIHILFIFFFHISYYHPQNTYTHTLSLSLSLLSLSLHFLFHHYYIIFEITLLGMRKYFQLALILSRVGFFLPCFAAILNILE